MNSNRKKVLVTGAEGQLGESLQRIASKEIDYFFLKKEKLDISNINELRKVFINNFDFCINLAAYTNVSQAEIEQEKAYLVNASGVKYLSEVCLETKTKLIHISTDYVFDGNKSIPYTETDKTNPLNVYGKSKLAGENHIRNILKEYFIIRTSWLYSEFGNNFVKNILKTAKEKKQLKIVNDQFGSPTYARDLAGFIQFIVKLDDVKNNYGTYHFSNEGNITWFDFAKEIFDIFEVDVDIIPVSSENYFSYVKRPLYSVLEIEKIKKTFDFSINDWKKSLFLLKKNMKYGSNN